MFDAYAGGFIFVMFDGFADPKNNLFGMVLSLMSTLEVLVLKTLINLVKILASANHFQRTEYKVETNHY